MSKHYFTYKTSDDLRRDAGRLGVDVPLVDDPEAIKRWLAKPVNISGQGGTSWRIGNSLAIHPMEGCDSEPDGRPGELTFRRYRRFGASGAKLIWFEACAVAEAGRANPRQLWIHAGSAAALEKLLADCRRAHAREFGSHDPDEAPDHSSVVTRDAAGLLLPWRHFRQQFFEFCDEARLVRPSVRPAKETVDALAIEALPGSLLVPGVDGIEQRTVGPRRV